LTGTDDLRLEREASRYERHHAQERLSGEFVFVPERLALFKELVGGPDRDVLDLGCRSGAVTRHYAQGNRVVGVDVDRNALARIAEELGVETVWANAEERLPFDADRFDSVVCGELLEHVRDPADVLDEIHRVLRPGGTLVGSVPNAYRLKSRLLFAAGRAPEDDPTHLHLYSPAMLRELLARFADVQLHFVGGRYTKAHPRLLARDIVFSATRR
jgi:SAM-dependent methyltransferase